MMSSVDQVAPTPDPDAPMGSGRRRGLFVAGAGAVTTLVWSVGLNRAWGWDESVTVGTFATVPSLYQAATRGGLENHVLASLAAAAVHTITGSTDEVVLRLVFLAAGVLTVVLLAWALSRRFGIAAAAGGVAVFAANPMVIDQMRQVRGYAFLVVCAVASTLVLLSMLGRSSVSWWWPLGYGALLALGIGAHLYMMGVIVVHLAVVAARRRVDGRFAVIWGAALVAGLALNAMTLLRGLRWTTGRQFSPSFPVDLARELLGQSPIAVVAIAILLGLAVPVLWRRREVRWSAAAVLVLVLGCWVVWRPVFLYPRFFLWLAPVVALGVTVGLVRGRQLGVPRLALAALCVVAVAGELVSWWPNATADSFANRAAFESTQQLQRAGFDVCVQRQSQGALVGYTKLPTVVTPDELARCDAVVVLTEEMGDVPVSVNDPRQIDDVRAAFRDRRPLAGTAAGWLYFNADEVCRTDPRPAVCAAG